jgi:hypothetical protein
MSSISPSVAGVVAAGASVVAASSLASIPHPAATSENEAAARSISVLRVRVIIGFSL